MPANELDARAASFDRASTHHESPILAGARVEAERPAARIPHEPAELRTIREHLLPVPTGNDLRVRRVDHPQNVETTSSHRRLKQAIIVELWRQLLGALLKQAIDGQIITTQSIHRRHSLCVESLEARAGQAGLARRRSSLETGHAKPYDRGQRDGDRRSQCEEKRRPGRERGHGAAIPPRTRSSRGSFAPSGEAPSPSSSYCSIKKRFGSATSGGRATSTGAVPDRNTSSMASSCPG